MKKVEEKRWGKSDDDDTAGPGCTPMRHRCEEIEHTNTRMYGDEHVETLLHKKQQQQRKAVVVAYEVVLMSGVVSGWLGRVDRVD